MRRLIAILILAFFVGSMNATLVVTRNATTNAISITEVNITSQTLGYGEGLQVLGNTVTLSNLTNMSSILISNQHTSIAIIQAPSNDFPQHVSASCVNGQSPIDINNVTISCPDSVAITKTFNSSFSLQSGATTPIANVSFAWSIQPLPKVDKAYSCVNGQNPIVDNQYNFSIDCPAAVSNSLVVKPSNVLQNFMLSPEPNVTFSVSTSAIPQSNAVVDLTFNQSRKDNVSGVTYVAQKYPSWTFIDRLNSSITANQTITYNGLNITIQRLFLRGRYNVTSGENFTIPNTSIVVSAKSPDSNGTVNLTLGASYQVLDGPRINAPNPSTIVNNQTDVEIILNSVQNHKCVPGTAVPFFDNKTGLNVSLCGAFQNLTLDSPLGLALQIDGILNHTLEPLGYSWLESYTIANSVSRSQSGQLAYADNQITYWQSSSQEWQRNDTRDRSDTSQILDFAGVVCACIVGLITLFIIRRIQDDKARRKEKQETEDE